MASVLRSGEFYSIDENTWTMIASRSDDSYYFSMISVGDGNVYTFNGINQLTKTIRQYTIANDTWTTIGTTYKDNSGQSRYH